MNTLLWVRSAEFYRLVRTDRFSSHYNSLHPQPHLDYQPVGKAKLEIVVFLFRGRKQATSTAFYIIFTVYTSERKGLYHTSSKEYLSTVASAS